MNVDNYRLLIGRTMECPSANTRSHYVKGIDALLDLFVESLRLYGCIDFAEGVETMLDIEFVQMR